MTATLMSMATVAMPSVMTMTMSTSLGSTVHSINASFPVLHILVFKLSWAMHTGHLSREARTSSNKIAWKLLINDGLGSNELSILTLDHLKQLFNFLMVRIALENSLCKVLKHLVIISVIFLKLKMHLFL